MIGGFERIRVRYMLIKALGEIPGIGYVFVDWGTTFNLQQARLFTEPTAPILHTGQSHIALEFIISHQGAAFLPKALVENHLNEGLLHRVIDAPEIYQDVYLVYTKSADKSATLGPIISYLEELDIKPEDPLT